MSDEGKRIEMFFWLSLCVLLIYVYPLMAIPFAYHFSSSFADYNFLYQTFLPFIGDRYGLIGNLTRLLAPLVAAFGVIAFQRQKSGVRGVVLAIILLTALILTLIDTALLTNGTYLRSLNAHEVGQELTVSKVELSMERYQEVLLALIAMMVGLKLQSTEE